MSWGGLEATSLRYRCLHRTSDSDVMAASWMWIEWTILFRGHVSWILVTDAHTAHGEWKLCTGCGRGVLIIYHRTILVFVLFVQYPYYDIDNTGIYNWKYTWKQTGNNNLTFLPLVFFLSCYTMSLYIVLYYNTSLLRFVNTRYHLPQNWRTILLSIVTKCVPVKKLSGFQIN